MSEDNQRHAKWKIIGLDAADQNAITEGPNPDGPQMGDVAGNSFEQQVAMKTWVDAAVDMLNRGEPEDAILAKLAHDGCPDPAMALQTALEQPAENPLDDEAGAAPATALPPQEAAGVEYAAPPQGVMASTEEPNMDEIRQVIANDPERREADEVVLDPTDARNALEAAEAGDDEAATEAAREQFVAAWQTHSGRVVKIGSTTVTLLGVHVNEYEQVVAHVTAQDGTQHEVDPTQMEPVAEDETDHASEVQKFIDSFPEVEATDVNSVKARQQNLTTAHQWIRQLMTTANLAEVQRTKIAKLGLQVEQALGAANERVAHLVSPEDGKYLDSLPNFEVAAQVTSQESHGTEGGIDLDEISRRMEGAALTADWSKEIDEGSQILISEIDADLLDDDIAVGGAAAMHINAKTGGLAEKQRAEIRELFLAAVEVHRGHRLGHIQREATAAQARIEASLDEHTDVLTSDDGPAEAIFL